MPDILKALDKLTNDELEAVIERADEIFLLTSSANHGSISPLQNRSTKSIM